MNSASPLSFAVPPASSTHAFRRQALARQATLTKPAGSLGALEELAVTLAAASPDGVASSRPATAILFAADHPVARRGVSAYPQEVTAAMVANFVNGGAAASVLSAKLGVDLTVVDVGVAHPVPLPVLTGKMHDASKNAHHASVRFFREDIASALVGDIAVEDGLPGNLLERAIEAGVRAVDRLAQSARVLVLGEMGIGNTTVAAAVAGALMGCDAASITGAGTGVTGEALEAKQETVRLALQRVPPGSAPDAVLRRVGGREIAALVGAAGRAVERGMIVLVDGFIVSAAMLALVRAVPEVKPYLVFAHRSREAGHRAVLEALDARPLLDLGLRLGEASGALAALPLLDLACALHTQMATFEEAAVPGKVSPESHP